MRRRFDPTMFPIAVWFVPRPLTWIEFVRKLTFSGNGRSNWKEMNLSVLAILAETAMVSPGRAKAWWMIITFCAPAVVKTKTNIKIKSFFISGGENSKSCCFVLKLFIWRIHFLQKIFHFLPFGCQAVFLMLAVWFIRNGHFDQAVFNCRFDIFFTKILSVR